jgi:hypothetical protein
MDRMCNVGRKYTQHMYGKSIGNRPLGKITSRVKDNTQMGIRYNEG